MDFFSLNRFRLKEKLVEHFSKFESSQEPIYLPLAIVTGDRRIGCRVR
jgi:hypothetical protein